jgi:hypothetical protein
MAQAVSVARKPRRVLIAAFLGAAMAMVMTTLPVGAKDNPKVMPPQAHPFGATYGEWDARWWQWFFQTPMSTNPEFSPPGTPSAPAPVQCSAGQSGKVWFIGGTFLPTSTTQGVVRADVYRTCSIPSGTFIFLPVLNNEYDNLGCPNTSFSADELTAAVNIGINGIVSNSMSATIDGFPVSGLTDSHSAFRAPSAFFSYTLPADNIGPLFGCTFPQGTTPPAPGAIADGVYLMLKPLRPGAHAIHFGGELNVPTNPTPPAPSAPIDFIQNINYTITVPSR